jgi:hypothetical protein
MVTIKIKENSLQAKLFLEYVKSLSFVQFVDVESPSKKKKKMISDIEKGLEEVKNIRTGKSKALTTKDLWDE